jgi:hypothetical protein
MRHGTTAFLAAAIAAAAGAAPAMDAPVAPLAAIHASFESQLGADDVREVRLYVDGQDVTTEARIGALRVEYVPSEPMRDGAHAARVVVTDSMGRAFTKDWTFTVMEQEAVQVATFFTSELAVELDPLPRSVHRASVRVAGLTQPAVEVIVRVGDDEVDRVFSSPAGRFETLVDLRAGDNELELVAVRPTTGEEGEGVRARVERLLAGREPRSPAVNPWMRPSLARLEDRAPRVGASRPADLEILVPDPEDPPQGESPRPHPPGTRPGHAPSLSFRTIRRPERRSSSPSPWTARRSAPSTSPCWAALPPAGWSPCT